MPDPSHVSALVLAAGKGTRMYSAALPKVMQPLLAEPMLAYVYAALDPVLGAEAVHTVVGFAAERVRTAFPGHLPRMVEQTEQLGTGHALQVAWSALQGAGRPYCLVVNGDCPLITPAHIEELVSRAHGCDLAFATITPPMPNRFGKVLRDGQGMVKAIIEAKDYDPARHGPEPEEVNAGIYLLRLEAIEPILGKLSADNKAGEIYITDLISLAVDGGMVVQSMVFGDDPGLLGVDTPQALVAAEETLRQRIVREWLHAGVIVRQGAAVRIGPRVRLSPGVDLTGPCELYGATSLAAGCRVASHTVLTDCELAEGVQVHSFSHLQQARLSARAQAGPFARLRPGAALGEDARVGNFVEVKQAELGPGAKAGHLSYLGDASVGAGVNIGAGTITCNYDGRNKHRTVIEEEAFIGSNTALVAPVTVGARALVGAGSTITADVPADSLALARGRQVVKPRRRGSD